ncbi:hypothetical protein Bbelb_112560 [Branchiostoma belcheri]|nr:hypothetical protein Bbelb_112560 [Branchiostoma belcheri]
MVEGGAGLASHKWGDTGKWEGFGGAPSRVEGDCQVVTSFFDVRSCEDKSKGVHARYARLEHGSVDMTLSKLKPIHANWVLGALDSIANNMGITRGWDRTGI